MLVTLYSSYHLISLSFKLLFRNDVSPKWNSLKFKIFLFQFHEKSINRQFWARRRNAQANVSMIIVGNIYGKIVWFGHMARITMNMRHGPDLRRDYPKFWLVTLTSSLTRNLHQAPCHCCVSTLPVANYWHFLTKEGRN